MGKWTKRHGQYEIRFYDNSRKPKEKSESMPLDTQKHVLEEMQYEMNRAYRRGRWDPWEQSWKEYQLHDDEATRTLQDCIDYYCKRCVENGYWNSQRTITNQKGSLRRFAEFVGPHKDITLVTEVHVREFLKHRASLTDKGELSKNTRNWYLRIIKGFFNEMSRSGIHDTRIDIKKSRVRDERIKYYTEDQMKQLVKHFNEDEKGRHHSLWPFYGKLWILLFYMGLRISEALNLQRQDYDLETNMLTVDGKWDKTRVIELLPPARDAFFSMYNKTHNPTDPIMDISAESVRINLNSHNEAVFDQGEEAREFTPHSFRHGCATYWLSNGVPVKVLADFMGHEDTETTYKYAKLVPGLVSSEFREAWKNSTDSGEFGFGKTGE